MENASKRYAFINRYDISISDSKLSLYAIKMYSYMVRMLALEMMNVCDYFDMVLSLTSSPDKFADDTLVNATIDELIRENWIVEIKESEK